MSNDKIDQLKDFYEKTLHRPRQDFQQATDKVSEEKTFNVLPWSKMLNFASKDYLEQTKLTLQQAKKDRASELKQKGEQTLDDLKSKCK